ncbi:sulfate ABC transporter substrate-binding protein [Paenibacillus lentus]|uniref:Sulfate ABC transporter substrate-binding protein n=1 Tax=Paenibacillus lentus TaxID=1338368 RepID=A0A3S8RPX6_9BACL|nr:sulfate ABC transporter substrate-binding protein [Paenibacillus lentus]AZK45010.1 sulfate ABC transporter substrate-binding protein [Paenibacillus lentus]
MKKVLKQGMVVSLVLAVSLVATACGDKSSATDAEGNGGKAKEITLLNVSYDPTRELYSEFNEVFAAHWEQKSGQKVKIRQSHGGSGKQGRAVIDGLDADVVTLALGYDIDAVQQAGLIHEGWQQKYDHNSSPYTSTIVFLVRKGNPKGIKDWDDLIKDGIEVITPNPQTSGGARWNYLAAWGYAMHQNNNDEVKAQEFVKELYENVPVLDSGARGATTTFVERGLGDVLLAWENEAWLSVEELGPDKFDIVYPSESIIAEPPVAVVDKNIDKKGTREVAEAYLEYLYSEEGQTIAAENYYRPTLDSVKSKFEGAFPEIKLFTIDEEFGGWAAVHEKHFRDGGIFTQIYAPK